MMRRGALLLLGLLLLVSGCSGSGPICDDTSGKPVASCPSPNPEPTEPVKEPPSPPVTQQPTEANLIRWIAINGNPIDGESVEVPPEPASVTIKFTQLMNRGSVEYRLRDLPTGTTFEWHARDQLTVHVPAGGSFSIYLAGALSDDGRSVQDAKRSLRVTRLTPTTFRLYDPASLLAGGPALLASSLLMPEYATFQLSPDRSQAVVYAGDLWTPPSDPFLVDLHTGERSPLRGAPKDPFFCWAGWRADGTLLMADFDGLWKVEQGELLRWTTESKRGCWVAVRSPSGRYLATWSPLRLIDLETGAIVTVDGRFDPVAQDGGVSPHWSPDGDQVAIGNALQSGIWGGPIETVIVNLDGSIARRIPGWWPVAWLPDGDLVVQRPMKEFGEIERARLMSEGQPSPRPVPPEGHYSPDGRWVVPYDNSPKRLIEIATGRQVLLPESVLYTRWRPDSTLLLVDR